MFDRLKISGVIISLVTQIVIFSCYVVQGNVIVSVIC